MKFKGTKGDWIVTTDFREPTIINESNQIIFTHNKACFDNEDELHKYYSHNKMMSNAKLIAAAPELLEALQSVTTQFNDLLNSLYGQNMNIVGWHLNGDYETFDSFIDDNNEGGLELADKAINKALN